jgi:hypothetical protein
MHFVTASLITLVMRYVCLLLVVSGHVSLYM